MHTLWYIWIDYFWASLKGNGPEALVQTATYAAIVIAVYPPLRKWLTREEREAAAELHRKMDHIIFHHPDIPPLPPVAQTDASVKA